MHASLGVPAWLIACWAQAVRPTLADCMLGAGSEAQPCAAAGSQKDASSRLAGLAVPLRFRSTAAYAGVFRCGAAGRGRPGCSMRTAAAAGRGGGGHRHCRGLA